MEAILFADFYYGMSRNSVTEKTAGAISPVDGNSLHLRKDGPVKFAGTDWQINFNFNNLGELQEVILYKAGKIAQEGKALTQALRDSGWFPAYYENGDAVLDLLEGERRQGENEVQKSAAAFMEKAFSNPDNLAIAFCAQTFLQKAMQNGKIKTWAQAVDNAPASFCQLTLMADPDNMRLSFTAPLLARRNALRYGEMIRKN